MSEIIVLTGAGAIGQAIARRVSAGKKLVIADRKQENADAAAETLSDAGFDVAGTTADVSSRASVEALVRTSGIGGRLQWTLAFAQKKLALT